MIRSSKIVKQGFTLIELLVVISIIGILVAISIFGLAGARELSRDARRKSDLELIRSGIEIYKADCNTYPLTAGLSFGGTLVGSGIPASCAAGNTYIADVPQDPVSASRSYRYVSDGVTYSLCAALENPPSPAMDVSVCTAAGGCTESCNYIVTSP